MGSFHFPLWLHPQLAFIDSAPRGRMKCILCKKNPPENNVLRWVQELRKCGVVSGSESRRKENLQCGAYIPCPDSTLIKETSGELMT